MKKFFFFGIVFNFVVCSSFSFAENNFDGQKIIPPPNTLIDCTYEGEYYEKDKKIYYASTGEVKRLPQESIDHFSFFNDPEYVKGEKNFYFCGNEIKGVDNTSFYTIENGFAADKNTLFFSGERIKNSDPKTFEILSSHFARDKNQAYFYVAVGKTTKGPYFQYHHFETLGQEVDLNSLKIFGEHSLIDKKNIYYFNFSETSNVISGYTAFPGLDYETGEELSSFLFKDKNGIYEKNFSEYGQPFLKKISHNPEKFFIQNPYYASDGDNIFSQTNSFQKLKNFDFEKLEFMHSTIVKDNKDLYILGKKQREIDASSFQIIKNEHDNEEFYFSDKNNVYRGVWDYESYGTKAITELQEIKNADPETFSPLPLGYAKDKNSIFYKGKKKNFDIHSFHSFPSDFYGDITFDKYGEIELGKRKNEDASWDIFTFENIEESNYQRDKNSIFYKGRPMNNSHYVNNESFVALGKDYGKDKNNFFIGGSPNFTFSENEPVEIMGKYIKTPENIYFGESLYKENEKDLLNTFTLGESENIGTDKIFSYINGEKFIAYNPLSKDFFLPSLKGKTKEEGVFLWDETQVFAQSEEGLWHFLPSANPTNFSVVGAEKEYGKDEKTVFYREKTAEGANAQTFPFLGEIENTRIRNHYGRDKNSLYFKEKKLPLITSQDMLYVDRENTSWAMGNNILFYEGEVVEGMGYDEFLDDIWMNGGMDYLNLSNKNFYKGKEMEADDGIVILENEKYAKNKHSVFYQGKKIKDADINSFSLLNWYNDEYAKDKNSVFYEGEKITSDMKTFEIINEKWAKDKESIFYAGEKISSLDKDTTISTINNNWIEIDGVIFYGNKPCPFIDKESLYIPNIYRYGNRNFIQDKNGIYFKGEKIYTLHFDSNQGASK